MYDRPFLTSDQRKALDDQQQREGWTPPDETAVCSNHYCQHGSLTHSLPSGACTQRRCGCSGYSTDPPKLGRYAPPSAPDVQFVIPTEMTHIDPTTGRRRLGTGKATHGDGICDVQVNGKRCVCWEFTESVAEDGE